MYKVISADKVEFSLTKEEAQKFLLLWNGFCDLGFDVILPLPEISSRTFEALLRFLREGRNRELKCLNEIIRDHEGQVGDLILAVQYLKFQEMERAFTTVITKEMSCCTSSNEFERKFRIKADLGDEQKEEVEHILGWVS